jgi:CelD/BcsL family acetyltransferase involved in cellulose biosynthesis/SAM-dependent methyltransferase
MALPANLAQQVGVAPPLVIDEIRTLADLAALEAEWDRLAGPAAEPMQTNAWTVAALRALHADAVPRIIVVRRGAALAALAPLVEVERNGQRWLEFAGSSTLYEPVRMLADSQAARDALCGAIAAQRLPMQLQRIDAGDWTDALRRAARGRAVLIEVASCPCLRVDLAGTFESDSKLSSERAATLRRKRRQLEKRGAVAFDSLEPAPGEVEQVLREAFAVEALSWKGAAGSAVLQHPAQFAFFCELGRRYAADRALLVRRLRVGTEVAAIHVGVVQGDRCFELKIGFDEKFARQSPGVLLAIETLRDGARRGFRAHEFLGCAASWQEPFASADRKLRNLAIYPLTPAGVGALALDGMGVAARRGARSAHAAGAFAARFPAQFARSVSQRLAAWRGRWFDWRNSVDTDTRIAVADLPDIDARLARHAVHYEATSIPKFERAMDVVGRRADGFTFVDLGSGKGRVLMLAARRAFQRVIGVEISQRLHAAAGANVAAFRRRTPRAAPIECLCADASGYELPEGDLLVFLYNPFDAALLVKARDRMLAACARSSRRLCVVYINPLHHTLFENDEFTCDHRDSSFAVYWHRP